jgi:hypothetical protein
MGESKDKGIKQCVDKIKKSPWNTIYKKNHFIFEISSYNFKIVTKNIS